MPQGGHSAARQRALRLTCWPLRAPAVERDSLETFGLGSSRAATWRCAPAGRPRARGTAELNHTKENLQTATEELETSNEELQAANEELLASNEELQSTNEELQSSVNAEYQRKIGDLTEMTNDMENLLSSTEIGTIFLDRDLKIRKFTPHIADTFSLLAHDVGRSIETFTHNINHPELSEDLRRVISEGETLEHELSDRQGRTFFMRILPYRAKGTIEGVVLTLIDVSGLKAAEDALFHERYLLNSLLHSVPEAIYFKDARASKTRFAAGTSSWRCSRTSCEIRWERW